MYLFGSFLVGIAAGPLWVSQAGYVTDCANEDNKGRFNNLFTAVFNGAAILTNLIFGGLVNTVSKSTLYWILAAVAGLAALFFLLVRKPTKVT